MISRFLATVVLRKSSWNHSSNMVTLSSKWPDFIDICFITATRSRWSWTTHSQQLMHPTTKGNKLPSAVFFFFFNNFYTLSAWCRRWKSRSIAAQTIASAADISTPVLAWRLFGSEGISLCLALTHEYFMALCSQSDSLAWIASEQPVIQMIKHQMMMMMMIWWGSVAIPSIQTAPACLSRCNSTSVADIYSPPPPIFPRLWSRRPVIPP